jgi:hypothetical protein
MSDDAGHGEEQQKNINKKTKLMNQRERFLDVQRERKHFTVFDRSCVVVLLKIAPRRGSRKFSTSILAFFAC